MTSTLTPEEFASLSPNGQLLARIGEAVDRGDHQTAWELRKGVVYPAEALLAVKRNLGAEWVRKSGLKTETAEQKYGKDWLDRDL